MSSSYHIVCLSHDPALDITDLGYNTAEEAEAAIRTGAGGHAECDLLLVRWSGSPVEYGCPGHGRSDELRRKQHWCDTRHTHTEWIDWAWLHVLWHARLAKALPDTLARNHALSCWTEQRLLRLRDELNLELPAQKAHESAAESIRLEAPQQGTAAPRADRALLGQIASIASDLFVAEQAGTARDAGRRILMLIQEAVLRPESASPRYEDGIKTVDELRAEREGRGEA